MIDEALYDRYLSELLAGNRTECAGVVSNLLEESMAPQTLYTELLQRSLYDVGNLWERGRITVAVEHLATAITESLLASVYPTILANREPVGRKAVISSSVNEYHQVGARMVADILETQGWDAWFLGANTPQDDLLSFIDAKDPDLVGLSASVSFNIASLRRLAEIVRADFPQLDVIAGGQAFRWGGTESLKQLPGVSYVPTLDELIRSIDHEDAGR